MWKMSNNSDDDDTLAVRARTLLERGAEQLDAATVHRLAAARRAALRGETRARVRPAWLAPVSGLAVAASAVVVVVVLKFGGVPPAPIETAGVEDIEILAAHDGPEFYQDVDFYAWLDATERG